jgi:hypothetical protein
VFLHATSEFCALRGIVHKYAKLSCWNAADRGADIHVIVKIESADSIPNLQSILDAADGVGVPAVRSKLLLQHVLSNQLIVQSFKFPVLQGDLLGVVNLM